jgi:transcriptional regulator with XRE-family HTH domain
MPAPTGNKNAFGNRGGGRKPEYLPKYARIAHSLTLLGSTDAEIADAFGVSEQTINNWKKQHIEFSLALKKGKNIADAKVAEALFKRAVGYSHRDVDIKVIEGRIVTTKLTKHYPPDTVAGIFWLKNRQKVNWRDKQELGVDFDYNKLSEEQLLALVEKAMKKL